MISYLEEIEQELYDSNILVDSQPLRNFDAIVVKVNNLKGIYINSDKEFNTRDKAYLLGHEKAHIDSSSFYGFGSSRKTINRKEYRATCKHVLSQSRLNPREIKKDLQDGLQVYDIADKYDVSEMLVQDAIRVFKSKYWDKEND